MVVGLLFGNMVLGMISGAGIGTLVDAVYEMWRRSVAREKRSKLEKKSTRQSPNRGVGIAIGIMLGTAFGVSTNNLAVGLAFGLLSGAALEKLLQPPIDGIPPPPTLPTMREAICLIARLGGFLARAGVAHYGVPVRLTSLALRAPDRVRIRAVQVVPEFVEGPPSGLSPRALRPWPPHVSAARWAARHHGVGAALDCCLAPLFGLHLRSHGAEVV